MFYNVQNSAIQLSGCKWIFDKNITITITITKINI